MRPNIVKETLTSPVAATDFEKDLSHHLLIGHIKRITYWNVIPKDDNFQHRILLVRVDGAGVVQRGADRAVHPLCKLPGQRPHPFICEFPMEDVPKQLPRNRGEITKMTMWIEATEGGTCPSGSTNPNNKYNNMT